MNYKLGHPDFPHPLRLSSEYACVSILEDCTRFVGLVQDIQQQLKGKLGELCLSSQNKILKLSSKAELILSPLALDFKQTRILNKILAHCDQLAMDEQSLQNTLDFFQRFYAHFQSLLFRYDLPLSLGEAIPSSALLKAAGLSIDASVPLVERLLLYFKIFRDLDLADIFILVNLKAYLNPETLENFYKQCRYEDYKLWLLESRHSPYRCQDEKILHLDADFCELHNDFAPDPFD